MEVDAKGPTSGASKFPQGCVEQAQSSTMHETLLEDMLLQTWGVRNLEDTKEGKALRTDFRPPHQTRGRRARLHPGSGRGGVGSNFCTKGTSCRKARDSSSAAQYFLEGSLFQSTSDLGLLEES